MTHCTNSDKEKLTWNKPHFLTVLLDRKTQHFLPSPNNFMPLQEKTKMKKYINYSPAHNFLCYKNPLIPL